VTLRNRPNIVRTVSAATAGSTVGSAANRGAPAVSDPSTDAPNAECVVLVSVPRRKRNIRLLRPLQEIDPVAAWE
jgi:hypothetical protein